MKKHLLIGTTVLTLALSATSIYAQVVSGTSIVDKMKAVAHSFTLSTELNAGQTGLTSEPVKGKKTGDILTAGEWNRMLEIVSQGSTGSSGGSGWVDVPLTDTNPFEIDNCEYRFRVSGVAGNGVIPGFSQTHWYDVTYKSAGAIANAAWVYLRSGNKQTVYVIDTSNNGVLDVTAAWGWRATNIQKKCNGGGGTSGTGSQIASTAAAVRASGHTLTIPSGITDWPDSIVCDGYGGWAGGTEVLSLDLTGNNVVGYTQSEGIGVFFDPSTGVLSRADRVGACGASGGNITTICAAGRCIYGGSASAGSSSWVGVPLTDTASFNQACEYRFQLNLNGVTDTSYTGQNPVLYASGVDPSSITYVSHVSQVTHINSTTKSILRINGVSTYTVTKIEKRCN